MNKLLLDQFQDYVVTYYSDCKLSTKSICSNVYASQSSLHRILTNEYGYSIMRYVEYFRILKAIELTYYNEEKKVYCKVGYRLYNSFYKSFFRITKLHTNYFYPSRFKENKKIAREVRKIAKENPKNAINLILEDVAERYMCENDKKINKNDKKKNDKKRDTKKLACN